MTGTLVLKLVDTKYLDNFLKYGELHFGSTESYRKIEEFNDNVGIGDKREGVFNPIVNYSGYYPHNALKGLPNSISFKYPANIFCVTQLHPGIETANIIRYDVIRDLYQMLMNDTDYPKTIVGFEDFNIVANRIERRLNKFNGGGPIRNLKAPVHYVKREYMAEEAQNIAENEWKGRIPLRLGSILAANLVKEIKFSGEYEYRFVLFPSKGGLGILKRHHDNIRIGDLRDQAIVIGSLDDLVKKIEFSFDTHVE